MTTIGFICGISFTLLVSVYMMHSYAKETIEYRKKIKEAAAKILDEEAEMWRNAKSKLIPLDPNNEMSCITHDRFQNYIHNAEVAAQKIRDLDVG